MVDEAIVRARVDEQIAKISNAKLAETLKKFLVAPRCEMRDWDYGEPGEQFPCWIVFEHEKSNACIAYCEQGFGPATPWGVLLLRGNNRSMGLDCNWSETLEEAFCCTRAWE